MKTMPTRRRSLQPWEIITGVAALGIVVLGIFLLTTGTAGKGNICSTTGQNHTVHLQDDSFSAMQLSAKQCDTLTITNKDSSAYLLAFGNHDHHQAYPSFTEQTLITGRTITINLTEAGNFRLHDHYRDDAFMQVIVTPRKQ